MVVGIPPGSFDGRGKTGVRWWVYPLGPLMAGEDWFAVVGIPPGSFDGWGKTGVRWWVYPPGPLMAGVRLVG